METVTLSKEILAEIKEAGGTGSRFCYQCGKCDTLCPWNRVRPFSIRKIVRQATLGQPEIELDDLWRCMTCGLCPSECPRGVGQIQVGVSLRRIATRYGVFPDSVKAIRTATASLSTDGNPLGEDREKRGAWANGLSVKPFSEGTELLFFVGCYLAYDPRMKKVAVAIARILEAAGVDYGILGPKESCCGESTRKTGNEAGFLALAKENIKAFVDAGVKKILVASPHCYHAFKHEYPELMVRFEVVHITELLQQLIESGRLKLRNAVNKRVTYHDPCYLGRHNGIFEPPREVLKKAPGLTLVEMAESRRGSLCCGGGGGRIWMDTPKHERFANLRLAQAKAVGAELLVTSCPYCITNFEDARLGFDGEVAPEIKDVTEIVLEAL